MRHGVASYGMPDSDERIGVIIRTLRDEVRLLEDERTLARDGDRWRLLSDRIDAMKKAADALDPLVKGAR